MFALSGPWISSELEAAAECQSPEASVLVFSDARSTFRSFSLRFKDSVQGAVRRYSGWAAVTIERKVEGALVDLGVGGEIAFGR